MWLFRGAKHSIHLDPLLYIIHIMRITVEFDVIAQYLTSKVQSSDRNRAPNMKVIVIVEWTCSKELKRVDMKVIQSSSGVSDDPLTLLVP